MKKLTKKLLKKVDKMIELIPMEILYIPQHDEVVLHDSAAFLFEDEVATLTLIGKDKETCDKMKGVDVKDLVHIGWL